MIADKKNERQYVYRSDRNFKSCLPVGIQRALKTNPTINRMQYLFAFNLKAKRYNLPPRLREE